MAYTEDDQRRVESQPLPRVWSSANAGGMTAAAMPFCQATRSDDGCNGKSWLFSLCRLTIS
jgi:hypothetical protein